MKIKNNNINGIDENTTTLMKLMESIVEQNHDEKGIVWPREISPFDIYLAPDLSGNSLITKFADGLYESLDIKFDVLYDDRKNVTIQEKLKKAYLIGIPYIVVLEKSMFKKGKCTVISRKTLVNEEVPIDDIEKYLVNKITKE
ncbi:MAG: prolyl-tRNA synthetase [uncultured bacterium]|nr:MAG: prolyl-tRNA synthetase [uncultured bacterium]